MRRKCQNFIIVKNTHRKAQNKQYYTRKCDQRSERSKHKWEVRLAVVEHAWGYTSSPSRVQCRTLLHGPPLPLVQALPPQLRYCCHYCHYCHCYHYCSSRVVVPLDLFHVVAALLCACAFELKHDAAAARLKTETFDLQQTHHVRTLQQAIAKNRPPHWIYDTAVLVIRWKSTLQSGQVFVTLLHFKIQLVQKECLQPSKTPCSSISSKQITAKQVRRLTKRRVLLHTTRRICHEFKPAWDGEPPQWQFSPTICIQIYKKEGAKRRNVCIIDCGKWWNRATRRTLMLIIWACLEISYLGMRPPSRLSSWGLWCQCIWCKEITWRWLSHCGVGNEA